MLKLRRLVTFLLVLRLVQAASSEQSKLCKPLYTSSEWPSLSAWQSLNASISGNLLAPLPPAITCDKSKSQTYSKAVCDFVGKEWLLSSFHSDDPVSVAYPNWQDDACLPTAISNTSLNCNVEVFPKYVANTTSAAQVAEAVRFSVKTGVRLVVKGAAHDLLGR